MYFLRNSALQKIIGRKIMPIIKRDHASFSGKKHRGGNLMLRFEKEGKTLFCHEFRREEGSRGKKGDLLGGFCPQGIFSSSAVIRFLLLCSKEAILERGGRVCRKHSFLSGVTEPFRQKYFSTSIKCDFKLHLQ